MKDLILTITGIIAYVLMIAVPFFAWVTHVAWWISLLMDEKLDTWGEAVLAIVGTLFFPIGCIHGVILWL